MTLHILGLHLRDTTNIGDRHCHPLDYFDLASPFRARVEIHDVRSIPTHISPDVVVLGGGAIGKFGPEVVKAFPEARKIGWGIGVTSGDLEPAAARLHQRRARGFDFWASRDYGSHDHYVPCASCMHNFFDSVPPPFYDTVVFGHAGRASLADEAQSLGLPYLENNDPGGIDAALAHIASGRKVIASSFHGVYWATLMGRSVSMIPFGSKFFNLKFCPPAATSVEDAIKVGLRFPDALEDSRALNRHFFEFVINYIAKGVR